MPTTSPPSPSKGKPKQEIRNPRRLLILSPSSHPHSDSLIPSLLKTLTGHPPAETQTQTRSFAGYTTHPPLRIENRYYAAEVPIWVDEIPVQGGGGSQAGVKLGSEAGTETGSGFRPGNSAGEGEDIPSTQWAREFSSPEARVVRDAIGAVMICIRNPSPGLDPRSFGVVPGTGTGAGTEAEGIDDEDREEVRALKAFVCAVGGVRALIEEERGEIGAVPGLLVLGSKGKQEKKGGLGEEDLDLENAGLDGGLDEPFSIGWWEDQLCEMGLIGFEVVEWDGRPVEQEGEERNEYGELQGMRRVKEVLETHEWARDEEADTGLPDDDDRERQLLGLDEGSGFNKEVDELEREMVGLRFAIGRGGDGDEDEDDEGDEEIRVDAVEALLMRMRAIKDMSDELPENDRRRFAAKAVRDIMKDI